MKQKIRKIIRIIWITAGLSFFIWMLISMNAKGVGEEVLKSDTSTLVEKEGNFVSFIPKAPSNKVIFFYPGALVDPDAYAPLCRKIAEAGHQVILCKMPLRMASRGYQVLKEENLLNDTSKQYVLMGHSLGGKMSAQFVFENSDLIDRLILLGTSHPRDIDLSNTPIPILKIYGSMDGVAEPEKIEQNKNKLPPSTKYVLIEGANHSQFGYYGFQFGDNEARISREEQQQIILEEILAFLN